MKGKSNLIGRLVVVSHWRDAKLEDATKLGILQDIRDGYFYIQDDSRAYRHCRKVSQKVFSREDFSQ